MLKRGEMIEKYHELHPYKCPRCGNTKIGITYTTGTGHCGKCGSSLLVTSKGIVALTVDRDKGKYTFWYEDGTIKKKKGNIELGPWFWPEMDVVLL